MDYNEYTAYKEKIETVAKNQTNELVWNNSPIHDCVIMNSLFNYSNEVLMFCGKGSIFRECFKKEVDEDMTEEEKNTFPEGELPIRDLYDSIKRFFNEKNGGLTIVLEEKNGFEDDIAEELKEVMTDSANNITIYRLREDIHPEYHFSIGDNCKYRRETGALERKAFANFNDKETVNILNKQFNILKSFSEIVERS